MLLMQALRMMLTSRKVRVAVLSVYSQFPTNKHNWSTLLRRSSAFLDKDKAVHFCTNQCG